MRSCHPVSGGLGGTRGGRPIYLLSGPHCCVMEANPRMRSTNAIPLRHPDGMRCTICPISSSTTPERTVRP